MEKQYFLYIKVNREVDTSQGFTITQPFCAFWQYDSGNIFMDVWASQAAWLQSKAPLGEAILKNAFAWAPEFYERFEGESDDEFRDRLVLHLFRKFNELSERDYEIVYNQN